MLQGRGAKGFTLIELLIVVAIIAILALIAVPNFLEAQTRAKVSRVKADMRSLATAEEAYFVDWNSYTQGAGGTTAYPVNWQGFLQLTTPIAYITSLPMDPFGITKFQGSRRLDTFELGVGAVGVGSAGRNPYRPGGEGTPSNTFEIESDGPDHNDDTYGSFSTGNWPTDWPPQDFVTMLGLIYDPTNGTVSAGEIFRPGGLKPLNPTAARHFDLTNK